MLKFYKMLKLYIKKKNLYISLNPYQFITKTEGAYIILQTVL